MTELGSEQLVRLVAFFVWAVALAVLGATLGAFLGRRVVDPRVASARHAAWIGLALGIWYPFCWLLLYFVVGLGGDAAVLGGLPGLLASLALGAVGAVLAIEPWTVERDADGHYQLAWDAGPSVRGNALVGLGVALALLLGF